MGHSLFAYARIITPYAGNRRFARSESDAQTLEELVHSGAPERIVEKGELAEALVVGLPRIGPVDALGELEDVLSGELGVGEVGAVHGDLPCVLVAHFALSSGLNRGQGVSGKNTGFSANIADVHRFLPP